MMVADPDRVIEHWPPACEGCGEPFDGHAGREGDPVAHQVSEIVVRVEVAEHRRMRVRCEEARAVLSDPVATHVQRSRAPRGEREGFAGARQFGSFARHRYENDVRSHLYGSRPRNFQRPEELKVV